MVAEKNQKEKQTEEKKQHNHFMKLWRIEQDSKYVEGVAAHKDERACVRKVKELQAQQVDYPP